MHVLNAPRLAITMYNLMKPFLGERIKVWLLYQDVNCSFFLLCNYEFRTAYTFTTLWKNYMNMWVQIFFPMNMEEEEDLLATMKFMEQSWSKKSTLGKSEKWLIFTTTLTLKCETKQDVHRIRSALIFWPRYITWMFLKHIKIKIISHLLLPDFVPLDEI